MATECKTGMGGRKAGFLLIADGNLVERSYASVLVQRFGYNSCTAATGKEALEMAATGVPLLIITAHELPDMFGLEMIRKLKRSARTAGVPVIVRAVRMTSPDEQKYHKEGVAAFLEYPEPAEVLFRTVQAAIEATPRSNIRIRTRLPVVMNGTLLDCGKGECVSELSEYGMYIRTLHPCPPRKSVSLTLMVKDRSIQMEAEALYCHHAGEGPFKEPGMGLKFTILAPEDRNYLKAFIQEELMKGVPERNVIPEKVQTEKVKKFFLRLFPGLRKRGLLDKV